MKEIKINILTKLANEKIEKELDEIDKIICERLQTQDIVIIVEDVNKS